MCSRSPVTKRTPHAEDRYPVGAGLNRQQMSTITVRHGNTVVKLSSVDATARLVLLINGGSQPGACRPDQFVAEVNQAAHDLLECINQSFSLAGAARKNLGTALRCREVRAALGKELCKDLQFIAEGADAYRHLTGANMRTAIAAVSATLSAQPADHSSIGSTTTAASEQSEGSSSDDYTRLRPLLGYSDSDKKGLTTFQWQPKASFRPLVTFPKEEHLGETLAPTSLAPVSTASLQLEGAGSTPAAAAAQPVADQQQVHGVQLKQALLAEMNEYANQLAKLPYDADDLERTRLHRELDVIVKAAKIIQQIEEKEQSYSGKTIEKHDKFQKTEVQGRDRFAR